MIVFFRWLQDNNIQELPATIFKDLINLVELWVIFRSVLKLFTLPHPAPLKKNVRRCHTEFDIQVNIWTFIYLNCGEWNESMIDYRSYTLNLSSWEITAWKKNSGLNGIRTHDLCDTDAVLYQLSYQANWEMVILRVGLIAQSQLAW